MEITRIKGLNKSELTILVYLILKGISTARNISNSLEVDIYNLYDTLNVLVSKGYIIKESSKYNTKYKVKEDLILK